MLLSCEKVLHKFNMPAILKKTLLLKYIDSLCGMETFMGLIQVNNNGVDCYHTGIEFEKQTPRERLRYQVITMGLWPY